MKRASGADDLGDVGQEGDDVVLDGALDLVDAVGVEPGILALGPQGFGGFLRNDAQFGHFGGGVGLDLEPDPVLGVGVPDGGGILAGITGDHGGSFTEICRAPDWESAPGSQGKMRKLPGFIPASAKARPSLCEEPCGV